MRFFKNIYLGYQSYFKAGKFIRDHKLWLYFVWPAVLACLLFWLIHYLNDQIGSSKLTVNELGAEVTPENFLLLIKIAVSYLLTEYSKYVVLLCISPVLVHASAKTERLITGNKYAFNFKQWISDIKRAVRIAFRNLVVQTIGIGIWYLAVLIVDIAVIGEEVLGYYSRAAVLIIGFYFYGFALMDYSMERLRYSIPESVKWIRKNRGLALSIGSVFSLFFFIDIYHFPVGSIFAPILGVVAATLAVHARVDLSKNEFAKKAKPKEKA